MKEIAQEAAEILGVPVDVVEKVIKTYLNYIRSRISKISYRKLTTFEGVKTNFSLLGFGRLVVKHKTNNRLNNEKFKNIKH